MPSSDSRLSALVDAWDLAPCILLRIDAQGRVVDANARLLDYTGYQRADVVGRMRWVELLAPGSRMFFDSQLAPVLILNGHLEEVMIDLRGSNGRNIPALMNAVAITDSDRRPAGMHVALMTVPDRRAYEDELRIARRRAEEATATSTHIRRRLELFARANSALASSLDVEVALRQLAGVLVPQVADWCVIYAIDPTDPQTDTHWSAAHAQPALQAVVEELAVQMPAHSRPGSALRQVMVEGEAGILLTHITVEHLRGSTDSQQVLDRYAELDLASAIVVPSVTRGQRVAALILVRGADRLPFDEDDLADLTDLGARTGIVLDNLRRRTLEHNDSLILQQALLTPPPATTDVEIVTRYLPASDRAQIGGDWYDAFVQAGGRSVVVIGDVVGHDIAAAAAMGQLRGILRTIGHTGSATPAEILAGTDQAAFGLQIDTLATAVVARVEPHPQRADRRVLRWSNAGHPPPVLVRADGVVQLLGSQPEPLLGLLPDVARHDHEVDLRPGDTLLLYTDGLIERGAEDIDEGLARLVSSLAGVADLALDEACDLLLERQQSEGGDDVALLALRLRTGTSE